MPGLTDWFEVFRCGTHRDHSGTPRTITEADIDRAIKAYVPGTAPIVVGHPSLNAPAWGWVEAFRRRGSSLYARCSRVASAFTDAVREGRYKNRSISFNSDGTFRHIGFLGAAPPAVKGMAEIQFAEGDIITMDFNEPLQAGAPGPAPAEPAAPAPAEASAPAAAETAAVAEDAQADAADAAEPEKPEAEAKADPAIEKAKADLDAAGDTVAELTRRVADLEARLASEQAKARGAEFAAYADELVLSGRLKAGCRQKLLDALEDMAGGKDGASFAAPFNDRLTRFKDFLNAALPEKRVDFAAFCPPERAAAPADSAALAEAAMKLMDEEASAGRSISASAAVSRVMRGNGGKIE